MARPRQRTICETASSDLPRCAVLIGANGSGKSNLLDALAMAAHLRTSSLQRFIAERGGASSLLHYGPKRTREIRLRLEIEQRRPDGKPALNAYEARLGFAAGDRLDFLDEQVGYQPPHGGWAMQSLGCKGRDSSPYFHFHDTSASSLIRANSRAEDTRYLRSDGSNLAAYLLALSRDQQTQAAWRRISALVQRIALFVKRLDPRATNGPGTHVQLDWIDARDGVFGPHHLSDGTLRAIALLTALGQPADRLPAFASFDEPELGLHPAALTILCGLMQSVAGRCQILVATQSAALLDHFAPEAVLVVENRAGESVFTRLDPAKLAASLRAGAAPPACAAARPA